MEEPEIKKFPTEIFGHPYNANTAESKKCLSEQHCPFLGTLCKKPRKSEPDVKVGICSVGYKGDFSKSHKPVVICPHRFNVPSVFQVIEEEYLKHFKGPVKWISEVDIGVGGNIDWVAASLNADNTIDDFLCVEFQAAGTTGTPWQAVLDLKKDGKFLQDSYPFGINWANEFMKTMMQQVYKKGKIVKLWNRKIIFVVQDVAIDYLRSAVDIRSLHEASDADPIHFCTYKTVWENGKWELRLSERLSTDLEGINQILGGALEEHYPSVEEFKAKIKKKGSF